MLKGLYEQQACEAAQPLANLLLYVKKNPHIFLAFSALTSQSCCLWAQASLVALRKWRVSGGQPGKRGKCGRGFGHETHILVPGLPRHRAPCTRLCCPTSPAALAPLPAPAAPRPGLSSLPPSRDAERDGGGLGWRSAPPAPGSPRDVLRLPVRARRGWRCPTTHHSP